MTDFSVFSTIASILEKVNQKIEQCKKDIVSLNENLNSLKKTKEKLETPKWFIAKSEERGGRIILNLKSLSNRAKTNIVHSIRNEHSWISFNVNPEKTSYGAYGTYGRELYDGLTFYKDTEIIA